MTNAKTACPICSEREYHLSVCPIASRDGTHKAVNRA